VILSFGVHAEMIGREIVLGECRHSRADDITLDLKETVLSYYHGR
jgi:hypothetical protein